MNRQVFANRLGIRTAVFLFLALFGMVWGMGTAVAEPAAPMVAISLAGGRYAQDFDTLANTGTGSVVPDGWAFLETGTNANTTYTAGTGSSNTGDTYSFGASSSTERAFGGLLSGSLNPTIGVEFQNDTGDAIISLAIAYNCEQWRLGTTGRIDRLDFQYSTDATSLNTGTWNDVDSLDCLTTDISGTAGARDGNNSTYRTAVSAVISGLNIADSSTFWLRWTDFNASGSDDGLAIDDFVMLVPTYQTINLDGTVNDNEWGSAILGAASSTTFATTWDATNLYFGVRGGFNPANDFLAVGIDLDPTNEATNTGGTAEFCGATFPSENKPDYILKLRQGSGDNYLREGFDWNGSSWVSVGGNYDGGGFGDVNWQDANQFDFSGTTDYELKIAKSLLGIADNSAPIGIYLWLCNSAAPERLFNAWPPENNNAYNASLQFLYAHTRFASTDAGRFPDTYGTRVAWATNTLSTDSTAYNFFGEDDASANPWLRMATTATGAGGASCTVRAKMVGNNSFNNPPFVGINRYVDFTLTACTDLEVDVQMRYETAELNGIDEATTTFYRCAALPCAASWAQVSAGSYTRDAANNNLLLTAVPQTQFSFWTISDSVDAPTAVTLQSLTAQTNTPGLAWLALLLVAAAALVGWRFAVRK